MDIGCARRPDAAGHTLSPLAITEFAVADRIFLPAFRAGRNILSIL